MKIVNRAAFLALPPGTLYAKYQPIVVYELAIKDTSAPPGAPVDWWLQDLVPWFETSTNSDEQFDAMIAIERGEPSPPLDFENVSRDGLFEDDQLFVVFERDDVVALIARLHRALDDGYIAVDTPTIGSSTT